MKQVAALFVETGGAYCGLPGVDPWDEARDARKYAGPHPIVAHPPCQRWGRFWHGSTRKPHQFKLGDDDGCFEAALRAVLDWGGVLEHPAHSKAWDAFGLLKPTPGKGWQRSDMGHPMWGYWTCHVEQGHYGHMSRKPTWLLAHTYGRPPDLNWTKGEQRLPAWMIERYGYEKARRIGVVAMIGGKDKTRIRNATPPAFRDVLLGHRPQRVRRKARRMTYVTPTGRLCQGVLSTKHGTDALFVYLSKRDGRQVADGFWLTQNNLHILRRFDVPTHGQGTGRS